MDLHYKQELQVGFLVISAVFLLVVGMVWLSGRSVFGGRTVMFDVQFGSIQGLSQGDPVHMLGVRVGRVAGVSIEGVEQVVIRLEVNRDYRPRTDARVGVKSLDFLGAKFVDYHPGTTGELLDEGAVIAGDSEADIAATAAGLADGMTELVDRGTELISPEMVEQVHNTLAAAERALNVVAEAGEGNLVGDASQTFASLRSVAQRIDSTLANPAIDESISQLDELVDGLGDMVEGFTLLSTSLGSVMAKIDQGQGSIGRAINDSTLYYDVHEVLQSLNELLQDIKENPGRYGPRSIKIF